VKVDIPDPKTGGVKSGVPKGYVGDKDSGTTNVEVDVKPAVTPIVQKQVCGYTT